MFGFFRKKRREKKPTPTWVAWLVIGVVVYAMFASQQKGSDVNVAVENATQNIDRQIAKFDDIKDKVMPSFVAATKIHDVKLGSGAPAVCGQEVSIAYDSWLADDKPLADKTASDKPLSFTIGKAQVLPAFERGVIGMQTGGRRSIISPYDMTYGAKNFARDDVPPGSVVKFNVDLLSISPTLPDIDDTAYRIVDVVTETGNMVFCGDSVKLHMTLWSVDGKKLYSTKDAGKSPITFTTGNSEVFLGLDLGVIGMVARSQRMLIVPPAFQKTMNGKAPTIDFPLPKNQTILVDIEALP